MQNINAVTAFERTHFDPSNVWVNLSGTNVRALLGLSLSNQQIVGISGAPTGSTITSSFLAQTTRQGAEDVPAGVYFTIRNAQYIRSENVVGIFRQNPTEYGVYIKSVDFAAGGPKALAARMIAVIVRQAFAIGKIVRLRLLAAGGRSWPDLDRNTGERWGGYVAWPTYGFDMNLLAGTLKLAQEFPYYPKQLISRQKVSEVLQIPGGREFWRTVGDGWYMDFDLSSKSTQSIATLDSFLGKAGI